MLRSKLQTLFFVRFRAGWMNRLAENIDKNQAHQRKANLLRKKAHGLPHFGLMEKIKKKEAEGVTHKNFQWLGWDPLELNEAYRREAKERRKYESENDGTKDKKSFITTETRNFKEAVRPLLAVRAVLSHFPLVPSA